MNPLFLLPLVSTLANAQPPPINSHKLGNGLEVLVAENHALPLVTIEIAVRNGAMTESPEYNGLSHLYEHMFFKANKVIPNQEAYMARLRELGMVFNGTTSIERVNYFFTTTTDHLPEAMAFMRDAIMYPLFDKTELEKERVVVTGEIDRNEANPHYHFIHTVMKHAFWKYPSRKDPLGNRKTVLSATPAKMRTIQKRYYIPNNSGLVITGDVKTPEINDIADQLYREWKPGPDPFKAFPPVQHPPIRRTEVVLVEQPVQTIGGVAVWHGPSVVGPSVPMTYPADLVGFALRESSSPFQKALVDSGACVHAGFDWSTEMTVGPISLRFEAEPEKVDACVQAAMAELPKMAHLEYFSEQDMANAARSAEVEQVLSREKPSEYAHNISFWWATAGLSYYQDYVENLKRVTRADIAKFFETYVLGKPFVLGVMLSPEMKKERHLDPGHFEKLLGLETRSARALEARP
jgi:zinc protease